MTIHTAGKRLHLKISKMAKFEGHIFQNSEDIVLKIWEILQMSVG